MRGKDAQPARRARGHAEGARRRAPRLLGLSLRARARPAWRAERRPRASGLRVLRPDLGRGGGARPACAALPPEGDGEHRRPHPRADRARQPHRADHPPPAAGDGGDDARPARRDDAAAETAPPARRGKGALRRGPACRYGFSFSAPLVTAWPVAETSWPAPATVLQAERNAVLPITARRARTAASFLDMRSTPWIRWLP